MQTTAPPRSTAPSTTAPPRTTAPFTTAPPRSTAPSTTAPPNCTDGNITRGDSKSKLSQDPSCTCLFTENDKPIYSIRKEISKTDDVTGEKKKYFRCQSYL